MPFITEPRIQSFRNLGLQLMDLIPVGCRYKCSKWQKRGMQLQAIAIELQQTNSEEVQRKAQSLMHRISCKLRILSGQVESESIKHLKNEAEVLSHQFKTLLEGVVFDGKLYRISQKLVEGDPKFFWYTIDQLGGEEEFLPHSLQIGDFIYEKQKLLRLMLEYHQTSGKYLPPHELTTRITCRLKGGERKELSITEARVLMGYGPDYEMPHELDLSHVDSVYWDAICAFLIKEHYKNGYQCTSDQIVHLQAFLMRYRPNLVLLSSITADSTILTISADSLSFPASQFRIEMKELLNRYDKTEFVNLLFNCKDGFENVVIYQLHLKDFLRLLDDPEIDPTFKEDRKNHATCRFRNDFEEAISLLEMRILLGKKPWDKLPESLDMTEIPQPYFQFLLNMAWNPMRSLSSINQGQYHSNPVKHDQIHFLALFLAKHRPAEYAKFAAKGCPDTYVDDTGQLRAHPSRDSIPCVSVSESFFQLSRADLKNFLLKAPHFEQLILGRRWRIKKDLLESLVSDPQFSPADLSNTPTVLLMDGLLHRVPMEFYYEVLFVFRQKDWFLLPDGSLRPIDLRTISPNAFHDAVYWYRHGEMRSSSFERIQDMTLFLQEWSPGSSCTLAAQEYLVNIEVIPMADYSTWEDIEDWIAPYVEAAPKHGVQVGENGPLYSRLFIHQLAKEKKIPLAFLTKMFHFRLSDGSTNATDISSIYPFWNGFKATFDPQNPDAFASIENPIVLELPPGLFQRLNGFIHEKNPNAFASLENHLVCYLSPRFIQGLYGFIHDPERSDYSVANLVSLRRFFHTHAFADCCQIVEKHLSSTREAIIKADWTQKGVWNSITEQLQQVPKAHLLKIEGVRDKFSREALEFCIRDGTITQLEMDTIVDRTFVKIIPVSRLEDLEDLSLYLKSSVLTPPVEPKSTKYMLIGLIAGAAIALVGLVWRTQAVHRIFTATAYQNGFAPTRVHRVWSFVMQKTNSIFAPLHTAIRTLFGLSGTAV